MQVATTFLLHGTATKLQTALHGSTLWAGSVLAGPEAILNLPSAALIISGGETHQPMLVVCLTLLVQLQANTSAAGRSIHALLMSKSQAEYTAHLPGLETHTNNRKWQSIPT